MRPSPAGAIGSEAAALLALLHGGARTTFQTFDESHLKRRSLTRILDGSLEQHGEMLQALNQEGAGVFFMVNLGDGKGRASGNVRQVRAIFVDLDGAPLEPVLAGPLAPHATIESSSGRYHAYWAVEAVPLPEFTPLQRSLAQRFGGDSKVTDLPRVMRLPGFEHRKGSPFLTKLLSISENLTAYHRDEVVAAFGLCGPQGAGERIPKLVTLDEVIPKGARNDTLFRLARGLVNKGFGSGEVLKRIQRVNAERCAPPLCATEVDAIVSSASSFGAAGYLSLPLAVFDSEAYRGLSHAARTVTAMAYRRFNGQNNGNISLPFDDFSKEFSRSQSFYKAREEAVQSGLIRVTRERRYHKRGGREPNLYEVVMKPPTVLNQKR